MDRKQTPADLTPHELGREGERLACDLLSDNGFEIIERNWRKRSGEIDIVALKGDMLHFVEVKTRYMYDRRRSSPKSAVDSPKRAQLFRLAEWYLQENRKRIEGMKLRGCRLDVITIRYYRDRPPNVQFIERAISY